jgi:hypothetical protein
MAAGQLVRANRRLYRDARQLLDERCRRRARRTIDTLNRVEAEGLGQGPAGAQTLLDDQRTTCRQQAQAHHLTTAQTRLDDLLPVSVAARNGLAIGSLLSQ